MQPIEELSPQIGDRLNIMFHDGQQYQATVIAYEPKDTDYSWMLGWKQGETIPSGTINNLGLSTRPSHSAWLHLRSKIWICIFSTTGVTIIHWRSGLAAVEEAE